MPQTRETTQVNQDPLDVDGLTYQRYVMDEIYDVLPLELGFTELEVFLCEFRELPFYNTPASGY